MDGILKVGTKKVYFDNIRMRKVHWPRAQYSCFDLCTNSLYCIVKAGDSNVFV